MSATAYTILGVEQSASREQIAEAFRARCAEAHPDRARDDADRAARTAKMAKLTLAWRYLGDPDARAKYDRKLADLVAKSAQSGSHQEPPQEDMTIDVFLASLRSGKGGDAVADFARAAGLADRGELQRIQAASAKGAEVARGVADLIGLVRGYQR